MHSEYNSFMPNQLGQQLKEIRQAKGISLEEIANKTHIRLDYIKAIEAGEEETLLSPVQTRGFLRLIASELGVDLDKLAIDDQAEKPPEASSILNKVNEVRDKLPHEEEAKEDLSSPPPKIISEPEQPAVPEPVKPITPQQESSRAKTQSDLHNSTLMFEAIGKSLKERRELLSLSIEDIDKNIRIRTRYIHAMEAGQFSELPSPVQAKGMLQNYAEFLNLDVDQLLLSYADALQMRRQEKQINTGLKSSQTAKELSSTRLQLKKFFSLDLLVVAVLFIAFGAFVVWGASRIMDTDVATGESTELPEVAEILLATGSPTPTSSQVLDQASEEEAATEEMTSEAPTPIFTPLPNDNPINILIIPRQRAWVQVTSDAEVVFEGRMLPGNAYDYTGEENVEVLTGNAGALQVYFKEEDIGSLGLVGQVVNLIFTENGLVLPTPTNTPTITETPQASPTATTTPAPTSDTAPTQSPSPTLPGNND